MRAESAYSGSSRPQPHLRVILAVIEDLEMLLMALLEPARASLDGVIGVFADYGSCSWGAESRRTSGFAPNQVAGNWHTQNRRSSESVVIAAQSEEEPAVRGSIASSPEPAPVACGATPSFRGASQGTS